MLRLITPPTPHADRAWKCYELDQMASSDLEGLTAELERLTSGLEGAAVGAEF